MSVNRLLGNALADTAVLSITLGVGPDKDDLQFLRDATLRASLTGRKLEVTESARTQMSIEWPPPVRTKPLDSNTSCSEPSLAEWRMHTPRMS